MEHIYPYTDSPVTKYFKRPIEITEEIVPILEHNVIHVPDVGKILAVEVDVDGWYPSPNPVVYDSWDECQNACDAHNKWLCNVAGWDYDFIEEILTDSIV